MQPFFLHHWMWASSFLDWTLLSSGPRSFNLMKFLPYSRSRSTFSLFVSCHHLVKKWWSLSAHGAMYLTVCLLHAPGSIPCHGGLVQGIFPWLITHTLRGNRHRQVITTTPPQKPCPSDHHSFNISVKSSEWSRLTLRLTVPIEYHRSVYKDNKIQLNCNTSLFTVNTSKWNDRSMFATANPLSVSDLPDFYAWDFFHLYSTLCKVMEFAHWLIGRPCCSSGAK